VGIIVAAVPEQGKTDAAEKRRNDL